MKRKMSNNSFRRTVYAYYRAEGRTLPWRPPALNLRKDGCVTRPYLVFVSEVMLQQTQASRTREKYGAFIKKLPDFRALSRAPLFQALRVWQGLGYNRRALFLKRAAEEIIRAYGGKLPREAKELESLPGIGPATARSIRAFAFNEPEVFIETNIRSVYLHFFFPKTKNVPDKKLLPLIEKTLDRKNPREWYYALMDYGAMLKKTGVNPSRQSKHHHKQTRFKGSLREARGAIVRLLLHKAPCSLKEIQKKLPFERGRTIQAVRELEKEGLVKKSACNRYSISEKIF